VRSGGRYGLRMPIMTYPPKVDFDHTDPQVILPYGGQIRIDGPAATIAVRY
jgi:muramoyltetrapeptide carboxypeptidase LdcA involved in peptidoglycan recycling